MALETSMRRNSFDDCFSISASVRAAEIDDFGGGFGGGDLRAAASSFNRDFCTASMICRAERPPGP